jgi:hypothetical protein
VVILLVQTILRTWRKLERHTLDTRWKIWLQLSGQAFKNDMFTMLFKMALGANLAISTVVKICGVLELETKLDEREKLKGTRACGRMILYLRIRSECTDSRTVAG